MQGSREMADGRWKRVGSGVNVAAWSARPICG